MNLMLMRKMDEHYLEHPYKGVRQMHVWLTKDMGYRVNKKRIARLYYEVMGLRSISPGPHTSKRNKDHKVYPYLLRNLAITRPNQVWATDITYIPMKKGFMYLTAVIDLYTRFIVGWSVSNSMDAQWCTEMIENAVEEFGKPEILNTDQGGQYSSSVFTDAIVNKMKIQLSMDGKGRATDNAFIERFWRTVKYEKIYINPPVDGEDLERMLADYISEYNYKRRHSSIGDQRPADLFFEQLKVVA